MEAFYMEDFEYLIVPVRDSIDERIDSYFYQCFEFIERAKRIFIHCRCGVSRSVTITIAYLMWKYNMTLRESLKYVMNQRKKANPNEGFLKKLKLFEKSFYKEHKREHD